MAIEFELTTNTSWLQPDLLCDFDSFSFTWKSWSYTSINVEYVHYCNCEHAVLSAYTSASLCAILQLLVFFFIAVFALRPRQYQPDVFAGLPEEDQWPHFFKMPVLMLMLITLLNDGTLISIGYDNVSPGNMPEKWNLPVSMHVWRGVGCGVCTNCLATCNAVERLNRFDMSALFLLDAESWSWVYR